MDGAPIYVSRIVGLPLVDSDGITLGRVDDIVLTPSGPAAPPRVLGFVVAVGRRQIFVNANRVDELEASGVRLHGGTVDLRRFELRQGELLARRGILDKFLAGEVVNDLALEAAPGEMRAWRVASVSLRPAGLLRRRASKVVDWREAVSLFDAGPMAHQAAALRELHPADVATRIASMPLERRRALAEMMEDERLADLLEELPEDEQRALIETLDLERAAHVLEEMDADDAADLLAELPDLEREELLDAMDADDALDLRRLLAYEANTAGGLMTPDPLILTAQTTVAEALARMREPDIPAALSAQVFVVEPPTETPTGRYLGSVGFQRLLRERPGTAVGDCIDESPKPLRPGVRELEVARRLAAYDAVAVPVCDEGGRMVGAVTVDDVLDHILPAGWRAR